MADIYGINSNLAGVFKGTSFSISGSSSIGTFAGALVQSVSIQYMRQVTRVWELGSLNQYYVEGRVQGEGTFQSIVGPTNIIVTLTKALSDICAAQSSSLTLTAQNNNGCATSTGSTATNGSGLSMVLNAPLSQNFTVGAQVGNFLVDSGLNFIFTGLSLNT